MTVVVPGRTRISGKTEARARWMLAVRPIHCGVQKFSAVWSRKSDHAGRGEACGALAEEFLRIEAVGLARGRLRHADEDQVIGGAAFLEEAPRIGCDETDSGVGKGVPDGVRQAVPDHRDQDAVELDRVDPRRPVPEELPHRPVEPPAEDEDPLRFFMLQGRNMGKEFRLRPFGFEGEGVVGENGDLSEVGDDRDPPVGGVPGIEEPGMIPGRHPPVEGLGLPEEDRHQRRQAGGKAALMESSPFPEKKQGRCRCDQAAGDGQREVLDSPAEAEGGQKPPGQGARAFDPVGAGQCPALPCIEHGGGAEQEAREQADRCEGDDQRRHLPGKGEVGAGDAAEGHTARPEEGDAQGQEKGKQKQQGRRPIRGRGMFAAHGERSHGGEEKPDTQGDQIDQFDAEEGDVELPKEDDLPDQRDEARQEQ